MFATKLVRIVFIKSIETEAMIVCRPLGVSLTFLENMLILLSLTLVLSFYQIIYPLSVFFWGWIEADRIPSASRGPGAQDVGCLAAVMDVECLVDFPPPCLRIFAVRGWGPCLPRASSPGSFTSSASPRRDGRWNLLTPPHPSISWVGLIHFVLLKFIFEWSCIRFRLLLFL